MARTKLQPMCSMLGLHGTIADVDAGLHLRLHLPCKTLLSAEAVGLIQGGRDRARTGVKHHAVCE
jgi:hypothetical protein